MGDEEFLEAFDRGELAEFRHRDHLRLAWLQIRRHGPGPGGDLVAAGIRRFATAAGAADRYHETITRFWLWAVEHHLAERPGLGFDEFVERFPPLLDGSLPRRHWRAETLEQGRVRWREPDLAPLP